MLKSILTGAIREEDTRSRAKFFAFTAFFVLTALSSALVVNLFSQKLSIGDDEFNISTIVAPPQLPQEVPQTLQKKTVAQIDDVSNTQKLAVRKFNIMRVDEQPTEIPKEVSTSPPRFAARPEGTFLVGVKDSEAIGEEANFSLNRCKAGCEGTSGIGETQTKQTSDSKPEKDSKKKVIPPPPPKMEREPKPKTIRISRVLNGSAIYLEKPTYPSSIHSMNIGGRVTVQVTVDIKGKVISAKATSGHPLLRRTSETAALNSRFSPTTINNMPVGVSGIIVYNFN
ncbi:MAG: energy transducer TonB [Pyrinomonadaceae bacterium]